MNWFKKEKSTTDESGGSRKEKAKKEYSSWYMYLWKEWIKPIAIIVVVASVMRSSLADWHDVPTGSMEPTILTGDRIAVNKLAYDLKVPFTLWRLGEWGDPQRGDIVVFYEPEHELRYVKRVIGVPGDEIQLVDNRLVINGKPLVYEEKSAGRYEVSHSEQRGRVEFATEFLGDMTHPVMSQSLLPGKPNFGPVTVPAGHYFVMGDNRDNSKDSRYFKGHFIERRRIIGKAFGVALSFNNNRYYDPRWRRFFRGFED